TSISEVEISAPAAGGAVAVEGGTLATRGGSVLGGAIGTARATVVGGVARATVGRVVVVARGGAGLLVGAGCGGDGRAASVVVGYTGSTGTVVVVGTGAVGGRGGSTRTAHQRSAKPADPSSRSVTRCAPMCAGVGTKSQVSAMPGTVWSSRRQVQRASPPTAGAAKRWRSPTRSRTLRARGLA